MTPSRLIRAKEGGSYITKWLLEHKYSLNWPKQRLAKITPKIARFAMSGDPAAVTSATNHSIFIK